MRIPTHPNYLLRMLQGRLKKLASTSPVLAATFGHYTHRCGRPSCRQKGGRYRWKMENEGFNRQKNSGLNLEHVYSTDPEKWQSYYLLLQIAFILVQLLERGRLLRRLAAEAGRPVWKLFGSLKNVARRLLESVRYLAWEEAWFDPRQAGELRISLDTS